MARVTAHVRVDTPGEVRAAAARGARGFEVALKSGSLAEADYRVARIRARAGGDASLGLDASAAGWDVDEARRALARLSAYAPDWVIDPVPAPALGDLGPVPVPIVVDLTRTDLSPEALREVGVVGVLLRDGAPSSKARAAGLRVFVVAHAEGRARRDVEGLTVLMRPHDVRAPGGGERS